MAFVIVREDEKVVQPDGTTDIGKAIKRFEKLARKQGIIRDARKHGFFVKPSQKKRIKTREAQKRRRKSETHQQKYFRGEPEKPWSFDTQWPVSLKSSPRPQGPQFIEEPEERVGPAQAHGFGEKFRRREQEVLIEEPPLPTEYTAGIIEDYVHPEFGEAIIILKNYDDYGNEDVFYCFPGGKVEKGETPEEAVIREVWEETGLETKIKKSIASFPDRNFHKKTFFVLKAVGGNLRIGEEIADLVLRKVDGPDGIKVFADTGLKPDHARALYEYFRQKESEKEVSVVYS